MGELGLPIDPIEEHVTPDEILNFFVNIRISLDDHKRGLGEIKKMMIESSQGFDESDRRIDFVTSTVKTRDNWFRSQVQKLEKLGHPNEQALDLTPAHTLLALSRRSVKGERNSQVWSPHPKLSAGISVSLDTYVNKTVSDVKILCENFNTALSNLNSSIKVLFLAVNPSMHKEGSFKTVALSQHQSICKLIPRIQCLLHLKEKAIHEHQNQSEVDIATTYGPVLVKPNPLVTSLYTSKSIGQNPSLFDIAQSDLPLINPYTA